MEARVTPDVLALLGDGMPRSRAAIVTALAGHLKDDIALTIVRLDVLGQTEEGTSGKYSLAAPETAPG